LENKKLKIKSFSKPLGKSPFWGDISIKFAIAHNVLQTAKKGVRLSAHVNSYLLGSVAVGAVYRGN